MKTLFILTILTTQATSQDFPIQFDLAQQYFAEAEELAKQDGGKLWGTALYGPMLFVDAATRAVAANETDNQGILAAKDGVFHGYLPADITIANTAKDWAGKKWTMLLWPLPAEQTARAKLMTHELFHRVQDQLGFPATNSNNNHLDTKEGRFWLRLELRALRRALESNEENRRKALTHALQFRQNRYRQFAESQTMEEALERNEGLAEYTGANLSQYNPVTILENAEGKPSYVRSFAYATGPAYGLLLDAADPHWRAAVGKKSFAELIAAAYAITLPQDYASDMNSAKLNLLPYNVVNIREEENLREIARQENLQKFRQRYLLQATITLPLSAEMNFSFDPNEVQPFGEHGTVYPNIEVIDVWGVLQADGGALMSPDFKNIRMPLPEKIQGYQYRGDGWQLDLKEGWQLTADDLGLHLQQR